MFLKINTACGFATLGFHKRNREQHENQIIQPDLLENQMVFREEKSNHQWKWNKCQKTKVFYFNVTITERVLKAIHTVGLGVSHGKTYSLDSLESCLEGFVHATSGVSDETLSTFVLLKDWYAANRYGIRKRNKVPNPVKPIHQSKFRISVMVSFSCFNSTRMAVEFSVSDLFTIEVMVRSCRSISSGHWSSKHTRLSAQTRPNMVVANRIIDREPIVAIHLRSLEMEKEKILIVKFIWVMKKIL